MAVAIEGSETAWPSYGAPDAVLPPLHAAAKGTRWIEVFNRGRDAYTWQIRSDHSWIQVSPDRGTVQDVVRLEVGVDWPAAPSGTTTALIGVEASTGERIDIELPIQNPPAPGRSFERFIENDGHIVIEAPNASRSVSGSGVSWQTLPDFGRTSGGVTPMPVTAPTFAPGSAAPRLEYDVYLYSSGEITVELHCAPSLDFQPGEPLRVAVSFDDMPPQTIELGTGATQDSWETAVADGVRRITSRHHLAEAGHHVLKLRMVTPGVVVQRIVIDTGGVRPSYLGPPASCDSCSG